MRSVLNGLVWMLVAVAIAAAGEEFERANADYDGENFADAVAAYEELLERDGPRAAVLQNLGSARFQQGEFGEAILAFERALLLKPGDPDLQANLKLAREEVAAFPLHEGSVWKRLPAILTRRQWSQLALGAAVLSPLSVVVWRIARRRRRKAWVVAVAGNGVALVGMIVALLALVGLREEATRGIVVGKEVALRISPFASAETRGTLGEGRVVSLGRLVDGYHWVTAEGGSEGWVADGDVEAVIPASQG